MHSIQELENIHKIALKNHFRATMPLKINQNNFLPSSDFFDFNQSGKKGIYIHIPFCDSLCSFCELNIAISNNQNIHAEYLVAIENEIKSKLKKNTPIDMIYLGGGSPSSLSTFHLEMLLKFLHEYFFINQNCEKIIEYHPKHLKHDKIKLLRKFNFNNIILGIQDFDSKNLKLANRPELNFNGLDLKQFDFNVTAEVIIGLSHQQNEHLDLTLKKIDEFLFDELKFYPLKSSNFNKENAILLQGDPLDLSYGKIQKNLLYLHESLANQYKSLGFGHYTKKSHKNFKRRMIGHIDTTYTQIVGFGVSAISFYDQMGLYKNTNFLNTYLKNNFSKSLPKDSINYLFSEEEKQNIQTLDKFISQEEYINNFDGKFNPDLKNDLFPNNQLNYIGKFYKEALTFIIFK